MALPEVAEIEHVGAPAFRVDGIFAQLSADEPVTLLKLKLKLELELGEQQALLRAREKHVWLPAHWGRFGWTCLRVESFSKDDPRKLIERSWSPVAPKRLLAKRPPQVDHTG